MENAALAPTFDSVDLHPGCQCAVTVKWDLLDPLHLLHRPGALGGGTGQIRPAGAGG